MGKQCRQKFPPEPQMAMGIHSAFVATALPLTHAIAQPSGSKVHRPAAQAQEEVPGLQGGGMISGGDTFMGQFCL